MLPFSVSVEGLTAEGQGKWVLALDLVGDRVLLAHDDKSLHWHAIAECAFHSTVPPNAPVPMMLVQPEQQGPAVVVPSRATRRHPLNGG